MAENPVVQQGLTRSGLAWAWGLGGPVPDARWYNWSLTWLSHMADGSLFGPWAGAHHLTSVALPHLQRAVTLRADDMGAWFNLGNACAAVHDLAAAGAAFERALDLGPDRFKAWNNLGIVLVLGGDRAAAEAAWRRSLAIRPDFSRRPAEPREASPLAD